MGEREDQLKRRIAETVDELIELAQQIPVPVESVPESDMVPPPEDE